ncbi:hypothetical protein Tco_1405520 [Tanacetum coccineum]
MSSPGAPSTPSYSVGSSTTPIYSLGASTPQSYSSRPSTPPNYSPGSSRNAECSNCKHLLGKISVLKATVDMYMHPKHTVNLPTLLHKSLLSQISFDKNSLTTIAPVTTAPVTTTTFVTSLSRHRPTTPVTTMSFNNRPVYMRWMYPSVQAIRTNVASRYSHVSNTSYVNGAAATKHKELLDALSNQKSRENVPKKEVIKKVLDKSLVVCKEDEEYEKSDDEEMEVLDEHEEINNGDDYVEIMKTQANDQDHLVNYDNDNDNDDFEYESEVYLDEEEEEDENNHSNENVVKRGITRLSKFYREYRKPNGIKLSVTFNALNRISGSHKALFLSFLGDMVKSVAAKMARSKSVYQDTMGRGKEKGGYARGVGSGVTYKRYFKLPQSRQASDERVALLQSQLDNERRERQEKELVIQNLSNKMSKTEGMITKLINQLAA